MKTAFTSILAALAFAGCRKDVKTDEDKDYRAEPLAVAASALPAAHKNMDMASHDASSSSPAEKDYTWSSHQKTDQKIIRSAKLKFQVDDLAKTNDRLTTSVKKFGGYLQNDRETKDYGAVSRNIAIRIPSKNFDAFLNEIASGVDYFDEKNIISEDVTSDYIDNESRIKTQKALENRYLELLKKANKVSEMIEIEEKLSGIREEIEAKQARLNYLQTQVDMSAFDITFYKNVPEKENASVSFGSKIANALKSGVNGLLDFFVWLLEMWPFIIILVAFMLFVRNRRRRRKTN
jgi:hypothetical protein